MSCVNHIADEEILTWHYSALKDQDLTDGIHEDSKPRAEPVGEKTTGHAPIFDSKGAIGKQFTSMLPRIG
jgi:hypothetical protein